MMDRKRFEAERNTTMSVGNDDLFVSFSSVVLSPLLTVKFDILVKGLLASVLCWKKLPMDVFCGRGFLTFPLRISLFSVFRMGNIKLMVSKSIVKSK